MSDSDIPVDTAISAAGGAGTGGGPVEGEGESKLASKQEVDPASGYWPGWLAKYWNDFRSAADAKANDGLVAPRFAPPDWADDNAAGTPTILDAARRRHDQAAERGVRAEERSARLVQTGLTLLALSFVATGFEANRLREASAPWWAYALALGLDAIAIVMLALAILQAHSVDRVGYAQPASPTSAAILHDEKEQIRQLAVQETLAADMANWTGRHKVNEFLQARAWFTRAVSALVLCGITVCLVWVFTDPPKQPPPTVTPSTVPTMTQTSPTTTA